MQNETPEWRVYHISPGRRIFGALCYGPCIAVGLALAIFLPPADRAFGAVTGSPIRRPPPVPSASSAVSIAARSSVTGCDAFGITFDSVR